MYYIIEHDIRPDGVVNTSETGRSTFASALAHYYDRQSKLVVNEDFISAHLLLVDDSLTIMKQDNVRTLYKEVPTEPEVSTE